jgi:hypothetical protein
MCIRDRSLDQMDAREKMYVAGKSVEGKGRFNEDEEAWYDDYVNPLNWITEAASEIGTAPYEAKESNSNIPYLTAIANPLLQGVLGFDPLGSTMKIPSKVGQSMESGLLSNTYKINPWAFKPNESSWYRQIGDPGYQDAVNTGIVRGANEDLNRTVLNKIDEPYFSKGEPFFSGFDIKPTGTQSDKFLLEGNFSSNDIIPAAGDNRWIDHMNNLSEKGLLDDIDFGVLQKDPKLRNLDNFNIYKKDWLKGYKEVPKPTSLSSSVENVKPSFQSDINWGENYFKKIQDNQKELEGLLNSNQITFDEYLAKEKLYKEELTKQLGLGKSLGSGSYGEVFELPNDASKVIKLGNPMSSKWSPELIENLKSIKQNANIAIPEQVEYFEIPSLYEGYKPSTKEVVHMPNLNKVSAENLNLNKRDRYALFLKQARQLRDKGVKLDVDNLENFKFNKDKGVFDIYDVNPGHISSPVHYMQYIKNKTRKPLFEHMLFKQGGIIKNNSGWLDKYSDGGTMQEHQENYNDNTTSYPEGFVGMGNNTQGRNYSPAWGGQFQLGGNVYPVNYVPQAQEGKKIEPDEETIANEAKAKEWLKNWYTGRAELPQFTTLANERLKTLPTLNYELKSGPEMKAAEALAYFPVSGGNTIYTTDPNDPIDNANRKGIFPEVFAHEYVHDLDYNNPQFKRPDFKNIHSKKSGLDAAMNRWINTKQAVKSINDKGEELSLWDRGTTGFIKGNPNRLRMQPNPEASGIITMLRMVEGIDPKQVWDEKSVMPFINKYKDTDYKGIHNNESYTPYLIQSLFKNFGNNPKVIARMLNEYVSNSTGKDDLTTAAFGGSVGGTFPGSTGFMYARTNSPAPSNGKYAKKTKASAQDGISTARLSKYDDNNLTPEQQKVMGTISNLPIYSPDIRNQEYQEILPYWQDNVRFTNVEDDPTLPSLGSYYGTNAPSPLKDAWRSGNIYLNPSGFNKYDNRANVLEHETYHAGYNGGDVPEWMANVLNDSNRDPRSGEHRNKFNEQLANQAIARRDVLDEFGLPLDATIPQEISDEFLRRGMNAFMRNPKVPEYKASTREAITGNKPGSFNTVVNYGSIPTQENGGMTYYQNGLDWKPKSMQVGGKTESTEDDDDDVAKKENAKKIVEIARRRIANNNYVEVPEDIKQASYAEGKNPYGCIGGVCTVAKEAGALPRVYWSNTGFAKDAPNLGFPNNGYGLRGIQNLEPGDFIQYLTEPEGKDEEGNIKYAPRHAQIFLGVNPDTKEYEFFDNQNKALMTYPESLIKEKLKNTKHPYDWGAVIYKNNPFHPAANSFTDETLQEATNRVESGKKELKTPTKYKYSIRSDAKEYNDDTKEIMDKFVNYANDDKNLNDLVSKLGIDKEEIHDSLLNVFGELGQENNWSDSGKGIKSKLENIAEKTMAFFGGGKNYSIGPGQNKFSSIPKDLREKFGINSTKDLYNLEKVIPLMVGQDILNKKTLRIWGEKNLLSDKLIGHTDNVTPLTADDLKGGVGRWSPYLRNEYGVLSLIHI